MQDNKDALSLLREAEHLPIHGCDEQWVHLVTKVLCLPDCYVPALQKVIGQNRWQRQPNPIGYVKTATIREAMKMGLAMDRYKPDEPRVATKDRPPVGDQEPAPVGLAPLPSKPDGVDSREDHLDNLRAAAGEYASQPDIDRPVPQWLCMPDGRAVDWDTVAHHAVQKPYMAASVGKALKLRAVGFSCADVPRLAATRKEAQELKNALQWIDRNRALIASLFQLDKPPAPAAPRPRRPKFLAPSDALEQMFRKRQEDPAHKMMTSPSLKDRPLKNRPLRRDTMAAEMEAFYELDRQRKARVSLLHSSN
jgi:hypothetical protein